MRGLRSTIAFVVVLAGLGAYIYFVTNKKTADTDDAAAKQEKVFSSFPADKLDEIQVKAESGDTTTLKKDAAGWQIAAPVKAKADEMEVTGIISFLSSLTVVRVIDQNPADLKEYGLATPRIGVAFKSGTNPPYKLYIGDKSPTGADLFAKRNDEKRVFLISTSGENVFNRTTFELRDKTLLRVEGDKVDGLEVVADGKTLQFSKAGADWTLVKPRQTKADFGSVEGLLSRLRMAQMRSIVSADASPADLKKYGLDKPAISVTVNSGSSRATLALGNKAPDNTFYARDASNSLVVTVESMLGDELKKGPDEYRRKDLFELRSYNTNRIELTRDGQTVVIEMTKGTGDNAPNKWRRVSPNPADLDHDKTEGFLTRLSNIRATAFVDSTANTGLDKPIATVKAKFEDTKEETVTFGKSGNDYYAARPGEPGAAKITAVDFDDAMKAFEAVAK